MALVKTLKCSKCDRRFSMPGHLARHMNSIHSGKRGRKPGRRGKVGRPPMKGRRGASMSKLGLGKLSLEQLRDLIDSARLEAKRQLKNLQSAFN